jgi:OOP family OmpA-OmpF porin
MKVIGLSLILFFSFCASSQTSVFRHPTTLGIHFNLYDFTQHQVFGDFARMDPGFGIRFLHGLSTQLDYAVNVDGAFADSVSKTMSRTNEKKLLLSTSFSLRARLFKAMKLFQPYLQAGFGTSFFQAKGAAFAVGGPGIALNYKGIFFETFLSYRQSFLKNLSSHYVYTIGISGLVGKKKTFARKQVMTNAPSLYKEPTRTMDSDGDGIVDTLDACPLLAGLARFQGCPDSDGDGIEDRLDKCPTVFGFATYAGCPIPDRDGDGINDEEDQCPDVPGVLTYKGCPVPDSDGDGINDLEDSCRFVGGSMKNHGCPVESQTVQNQLRLAARNIYFENNSYRLLSSSFPALDEVVRLMNRNTSLFLLIEGHTDNKGRRSSNQVLSENRALAVKNYLVSQGAPVNRLRVIGYGQDRPVADNITEKGRLQNRRVVFVVQELSK